MNNAYSDLGLVYNSRDIITSSGNYTAPVSGWYKVTVKGGGGGGAKGEVVFGVVTEIGLSMGGMSGGEGGTSGGYYNITKGTIIPCVIGAGGDGQSLTEYMQYGGDSYVTINGIVITGNGGASAMTGEVVYPKGDGNLKNGERPNVGTNIFDYSAFGGSGAGGGGYGGYSISDVESEYKGQDALSNTGSGGGGGGARGYNNVFGYGGNGGSGFVSFEYFDPSK